MKKFTVAAIASLAAISLSTYALYATESGQINNTNIDVTFAQKGPSVSHKHVMVTEYDETNHWTHCNFPGCDEKTAPVAHTMSQTSFAYTDDPCNIYSPLNEHTCSECSYKVTEPKAEHTVTMNFGTTLFWSHLKTCDVCGNHVEEVHCTNNGENLTEENTANGVAYCDVCGDKSGRYVYWGDSVTPYIPSSKIKKENGKITQIELDNSAMLNNCEHNTPYTVFSIPAYENIGKVSTDIIQGIDGCPKNFVINGYSSQKTTSADDIIAEAKLDEDKTSLGQLDLETGFSKIPHPAIYPDESIEHYDYRSNQTDDFFDHLDTDFEYANILKFNIAPSNERVFFTPAVLGTGQPLLESNGSAKDSEVHKYVRYDYKFDDTNNPSRCTSIDVTVIEWFDKQNPNRKAMVTYPGIWIGGLERSKEQLVDENGNETGIYNLFDATSYVYINVTTDSIAPEILEYKATPQSEITINDKNIAQKEEIELSIKETWSTALNVFIFEDDGCTKLAPWCPSTGFTAVEQENDVFVSKFEISGTESDNFSVWAIASDGINNSAPLKIDLSAIDNVSPQIQSSIN